MEGIFDELIVGRTFLSGFCTRDFILIDFDNLVVHSVTVGLEFSYLVLCGLSVFICGSRNTTIQRNFCCHSSPLRLSGICTNIALNRTGFVEYKLLILSNKNLIIRVLNSTPFLFLTGAFTEYFSFNR